MKMSPIKKIVIGLAAITVALSLITANNMASIMLIVASRQAGSANQQTVQTNQPVQQQNQATNNSQGGQSSSGNTATDNTASNNTATTSAATDNTETTGAATDNKTDDKAPADDKTSADDKGSAAQQDALKMYVDAVNKAKASAKSVVKTKTSASHYKEHLVINGNAFIKATLEPIGKGLMGTFMKASEPNEEVGKDALPPQNIKCTLTAADLQSEPKVEKKGNNTVITLVLKGASDPKAGSGLGSAISIIEEHTITDAVAGAIEISDIHLDYDACTIVATVDASGNLVNLTANAPCILKLTAMGVGAEVGIECYDEFVITY